MTFASRMQHKIYWGPLKKPMEWTLKTVLAPWAYLASVAFHDTFWYPRFAKTRMKACLESEWGRLFSNWEDVQPDEQGWPSVGTAAPELKRSGTSVFFRSFGLLATCLKEAPEFITLRKRKVRRAE
jgi:hypothetical protein